MTRPEIAALTGLRGVAATLVMIDHYAAIDFSYPFPLDMLPHMYVAVDMFMILSGFVLGMVYGDRIRTPSPVEAYRRFLGHRIARLYPLYALTTLVCFGLCRAGWLTFLSPDTSVPALLANLLAVQSWIWPGNSLNGPGWSISTEWLANVLFPLLIPVMFSRWAAWGAALSFAAVVASAIAYGQLFDVPSPGALNTITGLGAAGRCIGEFAIGIYSWRLRSTAAWVWILKGDGMQVALLLALFGLMQDTALDTVIVPVCTLLLIGISFETSFVSSVLRMPMLLWLGQISYSIYLVHITLLPLRDVLARLLREAQVPNSWPFAVSCCTLLALVLATLTRSLVERPAEDAVRRLFRR